MTEISFVTYNTRGIRNRTKRRSIFRHIRVAYTNSIVILEETHSRPEMESIWRSEWGGQIYFSHGSESGQAGVAILVPCRYVQPIREVFTDSAGRIVCVEVGSGGHRIMIIGVYAPSVDVQSVKCDFIDQLRQILWGHSFGKIVLAGDFNIKLSSLDSDNPCYRESRASIKLKDLLDEFVLEDAWRIQHYKERKFTWRRLNPLQQSRIDMIFISSDILNNNVVKTKIDAGVLSDHNFVTLKFCLSTDPRGPGLWRFNNSLLNDSDFVDFVKHEINKADNAFDPYVDDVSKGVKVEMLLSNIRVLAIRRSKKIAHDLRLTESSLYNSLNELESKISRSPSDEIAKEYEDTKRKLDEIKTKRGTTAMLKSQAVWMEEGEKPTRYFLRTAQQRVAQKNIDMLQNEDGSFVQGNQAVLKKCVEHFKMLYSSKPIEIECMQAFALSDGDPRLSEEDKASCEGQITKEECRLALAKMARNKAAGISGFSAEFFSFFWDDIGGIVVNYINEAKGGQLFVTHRRGVLTLIPKKGNQKLLTNKRPICLLDVIYKLIAKVIVIRMNKVIDRLVHRSQSGFMKGRYIGENSRLISDVISYCKTDNIEGVLLAVDYKNAFDSIEHDFMWYTLESFNFGPDLISWIKLLYHGALLAVCNNGYTSEWFNCNRGTFQGSPLSGLLFNLVGEMLANRIRRESSVQGITISGIEVKIGMYADDTTMFLDSQQSVCRALHILDEFRRASGLEINRAKTKLMWIGSTRYKTEEVCGIEAISKIKILGIIHSATYECGEENIAPAIKKIRNVINSWSQRNLTIKGRITIAKTLLTSQIVYLSSSVKIPNIDLKAIQSLIMKFIWRGRPPKVAHTTLCQSIKDGGLKAPDVFKCYESLRIQWVKRLYTNVDSQWRQLIQARIGEYRIEDVLKSRNTKLFIKKSNMPDFYKDVIDRFQTIFAFDINSARQARAESIWHNDIIKIGGKPVFIKHMYDAGIKVVNDLIGTDGTVMNLTQLKEIYPEVKINFLRLQSFKNAIPAAWKNLIKQDPRALLSPEDKRCCYINVNINKIICLRSLRSHHIYTHLLVKRTPTAQRKWEEEGYNMQDWEQVYEIPYKCSTSTKLQSLHYRILHRYIPTRKFLCTRNVVGSKLCRNCFEVDNLQHFFYECIDVRGIWDNVLSRIMNAFHLPNSFVSVNTVIFGSSSSPAIVNLIILLCKQYVISCKLNEECTNRPNIKGAIKMIVNEHFAEKINAKSKNTLDQFWKKWQTVIDRSGITIFD